MTPLPKLFVNGNFRRFVQPIQVSVTQNIVPLSTATITLPAGEELPARGWVEMFTPYGSAGMYRVRSPHDAYGEETTTAELEHMISEVGDWIVKEEISEMLPAKTAMQRVFKHYKGGKWKLGSLDTLGTKSIACQANYDRVLDNMLALLQQTKSIMMTFDFTTTPWTINFVQKGTKVTAEGRLARNVTSATISSDDSELCTRVWYQTFDKDGNATWKSKDADTISIYGVVEGTVRTSADMTSAEITATVNAYLADHKQPRTSVSVKGVELCRQTGESLDKLAVGKLYRLALPDYEITVTDNITSLTWNDVYNDPDSVDVEIGDEEDTVVTFLHNLDSKGHGGGGGGHAADAQQESESRFRTDFYRDNQKIQLIATKTDAAGEILRQAGMKLNSKGVLIYATDNTRNIMSHIKTQADRISLVVTDGKNPKVKRASIILAINGEGKSSVKISADRVDLGNYAKVGELNAVKADISTLTTYVSKSGYINGATIRGGSFIFGSAVLRKGYVYGNEGVRYNCVMWD